LTVAIPQETHDAAKKRVRTRECYCIAKTFFLVFWLVVLIRSLDGATPCRAIERPDRPAKEPSMELKTRLNVLATIMSFGFLIAIVFGII
jgi:hypothetical protein